MSDFSVSNKFLQLDLQSEIQLMFKGINISAPYFSFEVDFENLVGINLVATSAMKI
jgi:hypothetical protein